MGTRTISMRTRTQPCAKFAMLQQYLACSVMPCVAGHQRTCPYQVSCVPATTATLQAPAPSSRGPSAITPPAALCVPRMATDVGSHVSHGAGMHRPAEPCHRTCAWQQRHRGSMLDTLQDSAWPSSRRAVYLEGGGGGSARPPRHAQQRRQGAGMDLARNSMRHGTPQTARTLTFCRPMPASLRCQASSRKASSCAVKQAMWPARGQDRIKTA